MVFNKLRSYALLIGAGSVAAIIGGILPDAVSHGIILAGRTGHEALAIVGVFLVLAGLFWYGLSVSLVRRFPSLGRGGMEMVGIETSEVECPYYEETVPVHICRKCGRCLK